MVPLATDPSSSLNVVALVSGGKDSIYTIQHCLSNGHTVVALANLAPPVSPPSQPEKAARHTTAEQSGAGSDDSEDSPDGGGVQLSQSHDLQPIHIQTGRAAEARSGTPSHDNRDGERVGEAPGHDEHDKHDLNSFMFQTAGHALIPLYSQCLDIPLFRRNITGTAVQTAREYRPPSPGTSSGSDDCGSSTGAGADARDSNRVEDETEDIFQLLSEIKHALPHANAVCSGAIQSTYQRTRVESVAVRLGLVPLAFLWQYPVLPHPEAPSPASTNEYSGSNVRRTQDFQPTLAPPDPAALLRHMAAQGMDARIVKVASGGLDASFLWQNLCDERTIRRVTQAVGRFGGSVLGEGGEFETLVIKGPASVWKKRIVVDDDQMKVVKGEGGEAWLSFSGARVEDLVNEADDGNPHRVSRPALLDKMFSTIQKTLTASSEHSTAIFSPDSQSLDPSPSYLASPPIVNRRYKVLDILNLSAPEGGSINDQAEQICRQLLYHLRLHDLDSLSLIHATIVLRSIDDFTAFNAVWIRLFVDPLPASRVTIASATGLPRDCAILVSVVAHYTPFESPLLLTQGLPENVYTRPVGPVQRDPPIGLHVQSRSHWAPANIGPYSQARAMPIALLPSDWGDREETDPGLLADLKVWTAEPQAFTSPEPQTEDLYRGSIDSGALVYIAGQIPLNPASMEVWSSGDPASDVFIFIMRTVLALQHLWRVATDQRVGFFTGAVAYLSPSPDVNRRATIAREAWRLAHEKGGSNHDEDDEAADDDDDENFDIWDATYRHQQQQQQQPFTAAAETVNSLPDWDRVRVFHGADTRPARLQPPGFFAVEVDALPRGSPIEWQAHGFGALPSGPNRYGYAVSIGRGDDFPDMISQLGVQLATWPGPGEKYRPHIFPEVIFYEIALGAMDAEHDAQEIANVFRCMQHAGAITVYATRWHERWHRVPAMVIPCRRVWGWKGEIEAGIIVKTGC